MLGWENKFLGGRWRLACGNVKYMQQKDKRKKWSPNQHNDVDVHQQNGSDMHQIERGTQTEGGWGDAGELRVNREGHQPQLSQYSQCTPLPPIQAKLTHFILTLWHVFHNFCRIIQHFCSLSPNMLHVLLHISLKVVVYILYLYNIFFLISTHLLCFTFLWALCSHGKHLFKRIFTNILIVDLKVILGTKG